MTAHHTIWKLGDSKGELSRIVRPFVQEPSLSSLKYILVTCFEEGKKH